VLFTSSYPFKAPDEIDDITLGKLRCCFATFKPIQFSLKRDSYVSYVPIPLLQNLFASSLTIFRAVGAAIERSFEGPRNLRWTRKPTVRIAAICPMLRTLAAWAITSRSLQL